MTALPLLVSVEADADANGDCSLQLGPARTNENWHITQVTLNNPGPRVPTVYVYKNYEGSGGFWDGTLNGIFASSNTPVDLLSSEILLSVWSLCTPGTPCNMTLRGERYVAF